MWKFVVLMGVIGSGEPELMYDRDYLEYEDCMMASHEMSTHAIKKGWEFMAKRSLEAEGTILELDGQRLGFFCLEDKGQEV